MLKCSSHVMAGTMGQRFSFLPLTTTDVDPCFWSRIPTTLTTLSEASIAVFPRCTLPSAPMHSPQVAIAVVNRIGTFRIVASLIASSQDLATRIAGGSWKFLGVSWAPPVGAAMPARRAAKARRRATVISASFLSHELEHFGGLLRARERGVLLGHFLQLLLRLLLAVLGLHRLERRLVAGVSADLERVQLLLSERPEHFVRVLRQLGEHIDRLLDFVLFHQGRALGDLSLRPVVVSLRDVGPGDLREGGAEVLDQVLLRAPVPEELFPGGREVQVVRHFEGLVLECGG